MAPLPHLCCHCCGHPPSLLLPLLWPLPLCSFSLWTEYHLGQLKAKLAKLRTQLLEPPKGSGGGGEGFEVTKFGHGRVALIGFPRYVQGSWDSPAQSWRVLLWVLLEALGIRTSDLLPWPESYAPHLADWH